MRKSISKFVLAVLFAAGTAQAQQVPTYKVDPTWPKPLPRAKAADGNMRTWITGEVAGTCVDSHDHIFIANRSWQNSPSGKLKDFEVQTGQAAPPVVAFDTEGNIVTSWGDTTYEREGGPGKVLPENFHGCYADYEDNIWLPGTGDGIVQKYTHDGKFLMQIGTKGKCDGKEDQSPNAFYKSCGDAMAGDSSKTLLNMPSDVFVDPNPDPQNKQKGSIYIADGYGNHRVVVFDAKGNYLRQFGTPGHGPGQFAVRGGGHPHCVLIGKDNLVYTCDRGNNRIEIFDKMGKFIREIKVLPDDLAFSGLKANDFDFVDATQKQGFAIDVTAGVIYVIDLAKSAIVGSFGSLGHNAGQMTGPHTLAVDSKGNVYVGEVMNGRRVQKFIRQP